MDRTVKALLIVIAVGIWANVALQPLWAQQTPRQTLAFVDYARLIQERRSAGDSEAEIQTLLLTHIAGNTTVPR
jgi:hypothetical protein